MFTNGKSYTRRKIHEKLGGQAQGGISIPAEHPMVFIPYVSGLLSCLGDTPGVPLGRKSGRWKEFLNGELF